MTGTRGVAAILLTAACLIAPSPVRAQPSPADESLRQGRRALERNALVEALSHFRGATEADASSSAAQRYAGEVAEMLGELGPALAAYRAAARLSPSDESIVRVASLAERMGQQTDAIEELQRWLPRAAREAPAELLFRVYVTTGDRSAALALATTRNWVRAGADYCGPPVTGVGQETRALLAFLLHPANAPCAHRLAMSLTEAGQARLARVILSELVQKATQEPARKQIAAFSKTRLPAHDVPPLAEALNVVAYRLATRYRHLDEAVVVYMRAIEADPKFSWALRNLGALYAQRGQIDDALQALRRAVVANTEDWRAHATLGDVALQARRWDEALIVYTRAIALDPSGATEAMNAGRILIYLGRREEGVKSLQHALTLDRRLIAARAFLNGVPDRVRMVDELLDASGLRRSVAQAVPGVRGRAEHVVAAFARASIEPATIRESAAARITEERLLRMFAASVRSDFDHSRTTQVLAWLRSPAGARIRQMEQDGLGVSADVVKQHAASLGSTTEIVSAMRQMDAAQQATESQLDVMEGITRGVLRALGAVMPAEKRPTASDLARDRQTAQPAVEAEMALRLAYTYRTATPDDMAEYLRFLTSDAGRWFTTTFRQASLNAVELASEWAGQEVVRRYLQQPPPAGTRETR